MKRVAYDFDRDAVSFQFQHGGATLIGKISAEAMQDHFGVRGGGEDLVDAYLANSSYIDQKASSKYAKAPAQPLLLVSADF